MVLLYIGMAGVVARVAQRRAAVEVEVEEVIKQVVYKEEVEVVAEERRWWREEIQMYWPEAEEELEAQAAEEAEEEAAIRRWPCPWAGGWFWR